MVSERLSWRVTCLCRFSSLDSCLKMFLWTYKEVDLAPHPLVGLVLQIDAEKIPQALSFVSLDHFLRVSKQGPCLTAISSKNIAYKSIA